MLILQRKSGIGIGFNLDNVSFVKSFSLNPPDNSILGLFFSPDGTKMFFVGNTNNSVFRYTLSTPWDISTAGTSDQSINLGSYDNPYDVFFSPDGTKMFITGITDDEVNAFDLSSAWDLTSATHVQAQSWGVSPSPISLTFKPDGSKAYVTNNGNDTVYEFNLSTNWDVSTMTFAQSAYFGGVNASVRNVDFKDDGTKMFLLGEVNDTVYEFDMTIPWDITSHSFVQSHNISAQDTTMRNVFVRKNGTQMFVTGNNNQRVYEYNLI